MAFSTVVLIVEESGTICRIIIFQPLEINKKHASWGNQMEKLTFKIQLPLLKIHESYKAIEGFQDVEMKLAIYTHYA